MATAVTRVESNTRESANARIRRQTEASLESAVQGGRDAMDARLAELEREWDLEQVLEAVAASVSLAGLGLGIAVNRKWLAVPGVIAGFLFQHAVQGWCPPLPILRALGVRTRKEIDRERYAIKTARGDFQTLDGFIAKAMPHRVLEATEL